MNYLLYGLEAFLINEEVEKIINKEKDADVIRYNLDSDNIKNIIDDCQMLSLFQSNKIVIIDNCSYFNRVKNNEDDVSLLLEYLEHYNPSTTLIIINHNETIDNTKKITKKIKEVGQIKEFNKIDPPTLVKKLFADYEIDREAINLLIERVGSTSAILNQEITKIKLYKDSDKKVTKEDILMVSSLNIDTNIYTFVDNIINKKTDIALKTYYEILKNNDDPADVIALIASKFRLMYQASNLSKKGLNHNEIAKILGVHPYPVKLACESANKYSSKVLLHYLEALADLDCDIKTGKVNAELGVELFILNI